MLHIKIASHLSISQLQPGPVASILGIGVTTPRFWVGIMGWGWGFLKILSYNVKKWININVGVND